MSQSFERYHNQFTTKARNFGYSEDNIIKCLRYAEPLISNGFPIIYNTSHLSALVGYKKNYLKRAVLYPNYFYRRFTIQKKNGGHRVLTEPLPSLKEIQTWILTEILYRIKVSRYAKAYVKNRGIKDHARYHAGQPQVLTLDIQKFFDSLSFELGEKVFREIGYSKIVANLLAKLCFLDGALPQGAPTSPYLSNILLREFDASIEEYCRNNSLKYTRYADDLAFSGNIRKPDLPVNQETELEKLVRAELGKLGLVLNNKKTRLMRQNVPQIVSGIIVNQKLQVPKSERNALRNTMYFIIKFGLADHLKRIDESRRNYLKHLMGRVSYVLLINPKDSEFLRYRQHLAELMKKS